MKWHLTCYSELILIVHNLLMQMLHLLVVLKILSVIIFHITSQFANNGYLKLVKENLC